MQTHHARSKLTELSKFNKIRDACRIALRKATDELELQTVGRKNSISWTSRKGEFNSGSQGLITPFPDPHFKLTGNSLGFTNTRRARNSNCDSSNTKNKAFIVVLTTWII